MTFKINVKHFFKPKMSKRDYKKCLNYLESLKTKIKYYEENNQKNPCPNNKRGNV